MKVVGLSGSIIGSKTITAMQATMDTVQKKYPQNEVTLLNLADYNLPFSDGRNYLEHEGDALYVTKTLMEADAIIVGTPIFQASIPGTLKNLFDLLPEAGFRDKTLSMLVTAGSPKHYLIAEQHLKPILTYMKANVTQSFVFIEEADFRNKKITNDDVFFRIERQVEDMMILAKTYQQILAEKDAEYGF